MCPIARLGQLLRRRLPLIASILLLIVLGIPSQLASAAEQVQCSGDAQRTSCRIDEPNVKQRLTAYPQVTFAAGDLVTVQAGGCVQTGGSGRTWKRYVDPSGPNADRLYHGLIQLPGVQSSLVHIQGVVGRPQAVPATLAQPGSLRLGYEDDGFGDNGYWGHDDGTNDQCKNVGNAFVSIVIDHHVTPPPIAAAPFDLTFTATDPNGFPLNPRWAWQRDHGTALPDADTQCFNLPNNFSDPRCTTQAPSIDVPEGWNGFWCSTHADHAIDGHVNWMAGTVQGTIKWVSHSAPGTDDDYNIDITTPGLEGQTADNGGQIEGEFDSDETIDHFHTPWWSRFHSAVDDSDASAAALIDGKPAIMVGLVGLDCEHGCATELHPVYAMAIHVNDNPLDDTWAIFARNSGDEGYCSQDQHYIDTDRIAFFIAKPGATAVATNVATTFLTNNNAVSGPSVTLVPGQGAIVAFGFPAPEQGALLDGELHLQWTTGAGPIRRFPPPGAGRLGRERVAAIGRLGNAGGVLIGGGPAGGIVVGRTLKEPGAESRLAALVSTLPRDKINLIHSAGAPSPQLNSTALKTFAPGPVLRRTVTVRVRALHDTNKSARDLQRAQAICGAFDGKLPDAPTACAIITARSDGARN